MTRTVLALFACLWLAACDVTVSTEVDVRRDGTGTVQASVGLDADALAKAGDLAAKLRVDDLRQAGWDVAGPRQEGDGLTWVRASKDFSSPEQAGEVLGELSGPDGPFRDLRLVQRRSFFHTHTTFSGVADLSRGLASFVDPDLEARLGGAVGFDVGALERRFGEPPGDVFRLELTTRLPGSVQASSGEVGGGGVRWVVEPGQQVQLDVRAETVNLIPWLPAIGALVAVAAAVGFVLWRRRSA